MRSRILAAIAAALTLTACTPEQLATWTAETGIRLDARTEADLLALPDIPGRLPDGRTLHVDGKVTGPVAPAGSKCPQHYATALRAGWPASDWARLDHVMWRESRCQPTVWNRNDPMSGSRGVTQINGFWCKPTRYYPEGYMQQVSVLNTCEDLFDPEVNLRAARAIYDYGIQRGQCPWKPWTTRSTRWCG